MMVDKVVNKVKALVLDFGGVVTKTPFETHAESEAVLGLTPGSLAWRGPFDLESDSLWRDVNADKISERDYWLIRSKEVGTMIGQNWTSMQEFIIATRSGAPMAIIRPEFFSAFERAKTAGIRLAILSNELDLFYGSDFRKKLPFLADFDPIIDATYTKILKPDLRAYGFITDSIKLASADCVFVDDQMRNITGAANFGMKTVHFNIMNPQASYDKALAKLGVLP